MDSDESRLCTNLSKGGVIAVLVAVGESIFPTQPTQGWRSFHASSKRLIRLNTVVVIILLVSCCIWCCVRSRRQQTANNQTKPEEEKEIEEVEEGYGNNEGHMTYEHDMNTGGGHYGEAPPPPHTYYQE